MSASSDLLQSEEVPSAPLQEIPLLQAKLLRSRSDLLLGSCPDLLCRSCSYLLCSSCCCSLLRCSSFLWLRNLVLQGQEVPSAPLQESSLLPSAPLQEEPLLRFQLRNELLRLV